MKRTIAILAAITLVTTTAPAALAQAPTVPSASTNNLGISENDVREEPSHPQDDNGFQDAPPGADFWSPKDDPLVLEGYVQYGSAVDTEEVAANEDLDNIRRRALHGNDYDAGERHMYPGPNLFEAWWGWWSDTGGGRDLQNNSATSQAGPLVDENGAIDDSNDCRQDNWDEFTWRGGWTADDTGPCVPESRIVTGDSLFGFVQPGTHNLHINNMPAPTLGPIIPPAFIHNDTDRSQIPDFRYDCDLTREDQECLSGNGFSRFEYDQSLLITTQVASAVNPEETPLSSNSYDPFDAFTNPDGSKATHRVDVDTYSALHDAIEDAYRTTVWNPEQDHGDGDDEDNPFPLHEGGPKQYLKEDGRRDLVEVRNQAQGIASSVIAVAEPQVGLAYDLFFGPRPHEPNTAGDRYGLDDTDNDGQKEHTKWATFDADTTYDPLDENPHDDDQENDYYEPGTGQTYDEYQTAEHTWMDVTSGVDVCPILGLCYHEWAFLGPAVPSADAPRQDAASSGDHRSMGPGLLYLHGNLGSWHDENQDTWVGDASQGSVKAPGKHGPGLLGTEEGEPYSNGLIQDPNQYASDEFRPICSARWDVTLRSQLDPDDDGVGEWGTTGVYVLKTTGSGEAYTYATMDVVGGAAEPVLTPLRNNEDTGSTARLVAPADEDGRLSRYRVEGPIEIGMRALGDTCTPFGSWDPNQRVLFPAGNPGYDITVTATAEVTEDQKSKNGDNDGTSLVGETIVDVDILYANQEEVQGQPVVADHPLGNNPDGSGG